MRGLSVLSLKAGLQYSLLYSFAILLWSLRGMSNTALVGTQRDARIDVQIADTIKHQRGPRPRSNALLSDSTFPGHCRSACLTRLYRASWPHHLFLFQMVLARFEENSWYATLRLVTLHVQ